MVVWMMKISRRSESEDLANSRNFLLAILPVRKARSSFIF